MNRLMKTLALVSVFALSACASDPKISYGDASGVETTTIGFGSTDLQTIAVTLVDDLLSFPPIVDLTAGQRPVVMVDKINNKTTEHIDTESITDSMQTKLLKSGKFRFVDMSAIAQIRQQLNFQQGSGLVDPATAVAIGKHTGAQFMLYGNLASIVKRNSSTKDVYYKFTLKMINLENGLLEWTGEKEIRKVGEKQWFSL